MELVHSHVFILPFTFTTTALTLAPSVNSNIYASGMSKLLELIEPRVSRKNRNCDCENSEQYNKSMHVNIPGNTKPPYIYSNPVYSTGSSDYSMASSEEEEEEEEEFHQHHDIHDIRVVTEVSLTARERIPLSLSVPRPFCDIHVLVEPSQNETILAPNVGQVQPPTVQTTISVPVQEDLPPSYFSATKDPPSYSSLETGVKQ